MPSYLGRAAVLGRPRSAHRGSQRRQSGRFSGGVTPSANSIGDEFVAGAAERDEIVLHGLIGNPSIARWAMMNVEIIRGITQAAAAAVPLQPGVAFPLPGSRLDVVFVHAVISPSAIQMLRFARST